MNPTVQKAHVKAPNIETHARGLKESAVSYFHCSLKHILRTCIQLEDYPFVTYCWSMGILRPGK